MKARYLSLHLLSLFFISACGQDVPNVESNSKLESNAIHGTEATKELFEDATVVIRFEGCQNCIATGTLIAKDLVLTAGHATRWTSAASIYVQTGVEPSQETSEKWRVASKIEHSGGADLSLLKLERPIDSIYPEKLICNIDSVKAGDKIKFVGYGGRGTFSLKPDKGVKYSGYSSYSHEYRYLDGNTTFYSGESSGAFTGLGDSGGPTFAYVEGNKKLIGVNIFLIIYTDRSPNVGRVEGMSVARYVDWILIQASAMNSTLVPPCLGEETPLEQRLPDAPVPQNGTSLF